MEHATAAQDRVALAIVLAFAREGAKVAVTARTAKELDDVVGAIESAGGRAIAISADLADRNAPAHVVARSSRLWGRWKSWSTTPALAAAPTHGRSLISTMPS